MASKPDALDECEEKLLVMYIAKYNPQSEDRDNPRLYQALVADDGAWGWARKYDWQTWRAHYIDNRGRLDGLIAQRQKGSGVRITKNSSKRPARDPTRRVRIEFTGADDEHLVQYLAIENPLPKDRQGKIIYERLVANPDGLWPWAARHTAQSWRDRYVKQLRGYDIRIKRFMQKHGIEHLDVASPAQRRVVWAKLGKNGQKDPTQPERTRAAESSTNRGRPSRDMDQPQQNAAARGEARSLMSKRAMGKQRALTDDDDDRACKKARVEKDTVQALDTGGQETEPFAVSVPQDAHRPMSVPPIAVVRQPSEESSSDAEMDELLDNEGHTADRVKHTSEVSASRESMAAKALGAGRPRHDVANEEAPVESARFSHPVNAVRNIVEVVAKDSDGHLNDVSFGSPHPIRAPSQDQYPATSTPRGEAPPPVSQAIPTPRTLEALTLKEAATALRAGQAVQEPTPPTSDAPPSPTLNNRNIASNPPENRGGDTIEPERAIHQSERMQGGPASRESSVSPPSTPSPPQFPARKRKIVRRDVDEDEDFFATPEPSRAAVPSSTPRRRRARQLPIRAEGALNSALTDARGFASALKKGARKANDGDEDIHASADDDAEASRDWPPKRGKATTHGEQKATTAKFVKQKTAQTRVKTETADAEIASSQEVLNRRHHPFSQPTQPLGPLRMLHHPFSQPTQSTVIAGPSNIPHEAEASSDDPFSDSRESLVACEHPPKTSVLRVNQRREGLIREPVSLRTKSIAFTTAPTLEDDQGLGSSQVTRADKGKHRAVEPRYPDFLSSRRHTFAGLSQPIEHGEIRWARPSSPSIPSHTSSVPVSSSGSVRLVCGDVTLDPRDHAETYETMLKRAVRKTGYPKDVVHNVWRATGSWTAACQVLTAKRVQDQTKLAIAEAIEEYSRTDVSSDNGFGRSLLRDVSSDRPKTPARAMRSTTPESPAYVPPDNSRAAIYLRTHRVSETTREERQPERQHDDDDDDDDDDEGEDDPSIPIFRELDNPRERNSIARPDHLDVSINMDSRVQLAKRILAVARRSR